MPKGQEISHSEVMDFDDLVSVCRILARLGVRTVRVTGGEPLVRTGAAEFIRDLKAVAGIKRVTMTTNGVLLGEENLRALSAAGLDAVNISLDTLDRERFARISGCGGFENILPAIDAALELGMSVKVNCVPLGDFNEQDIPAIAELARTRNIAVRFIELMPFGPAAEMRPFPIREVASRVEAAFGKLMQVPVKLGEGPAVYHTLPGFAGHIGIIGAVSRGFCEDCNRLRITAAGTLKACLDSTAEIDLRGLLANKASEREIEAAIVDLVRRKPAGHRFASAGEERKREAAELFRIGG